MIKEFLLENILPNPYQTREGVDEEHIRSLADSIASQGLLQIPSARYGDAFHHPGTVELAFGHNRLAAFKYLRDAGVSGFSSMPLNIVEMSDEEMFQAAVAENRARKDLTPIEEARAMLIYRDQFKKNSEEIGVLFNLSDSAVRNKLRLLDLPDEIKELVGKTLTESGAREVLAFQALPNEAKAEKTWHNGEQRTYEAMLKEMLADGVDAGELKDLVDSAVRNHGTRMDRKLWKNTDELVGDGIIGLCRGCAFITAREGVDYCLKESCFEGKEKAWRLSYLSQASLLTGIAILDNEKYGYGECSDFGYGHEEVMLKEMLADGVDAGELKDLVELVINKSTWGGRESVLKQLYEMLSDCGLEELDISFEDESKRSEEA